MTNKRQLSILEFQNLWDRQFIRKSPSFFRESGLKLPTGFSIANFYSQVPWRFFSKQTFFMAYDLLTAAQSDERLSKVLAQSYEAFNLGSRRLVKVADNSFHDFEIPLNDGERFLVLQESLFPAYQTLVEGVFSQLILPFSLLAKEVDTPKISDFDANERFAALIGTPLEYLQKLYSNRLRNSIAHETYEFLMGTIIFRDRNWKEEWAIGKFIEHFDSIMDACTGLFLAISFFQFESCAHNSGKTILPKVLKLVSAKAKFDNPRAQIIEWAEIGSSNSKRILFIHIRNNFMSKMDLLMALFRLALDLSPWFGPDYEFSFDLTGSRGFIGGAKFLNSTLKSISRNRPLETAFSSLDFVLVYHRLFPDLMGSWLGQSWKNEMILRGLRRAKFEVKKRTTSWKLTVRQKDMTIYKFTQGITATAVLTHEFRLNPREVVRQNIKKILEVVACRKPDNSYFGFERFLPIRVCDITLFTRDFRKRKLKAPGLIPSLLCRIVHTKDPKYRITPFLGGSIGECSGFVIIWNDAPTVEEDT